MLKSFMTASHFSDLFKRTGNIAFSEEAARIIRETVDVVTAEELDEGKFLEVAARVNEATLIQGTKDYLSNYTHGNIEWKFKSFKLSTYFGKVFKKGGSIAFGDEAVRIARDALDATETHERSRVTQLGNLAAHLGQRYEKTREIADLEEGHRLLRTAIDIDPSESHRFAKLNNLAIGWQRAYLRTRGPKHLQEALDISQTVCESVSIDDKKRALYSNTLAIGLESLYAGSENPEHLDDLVAAFQEAVDLTPSNDPERVRRLHNLPIALGRPCSLKTQLEDINQAITLSQEVLSKYLG